MRHVVLIAVTCFMWSCSGNDIPEHNNDIERQREVEVRVDSLISLIPVQRREEIEILYDPVVGRKKSYKGVRLNNILIDLLHQYNLSADGTDVVFVCKDGYAPVRHALEMTKLSSGYIVYKDMEAKDGKSWPDSLYNLYSPFYLVWNVDSSNAKKLPWPYGLVQIRLVERDSSLLNALSKKSAVQKGYHLFRKHCFSCHSMNKIGGRVGPEMNVPKNITEYWTDDNIAHYIKAPKSFRYNAHMPAMKDISDEEIDQIIRYLHFMKRNKIP